MTQRVDKDSLPLDKPRRTPGHPTKSHIVKTKVDGKEKIIRFGEQGAKTAGKPKAGESERMKTKRASFKARHARNIAKGKSSPAYWANKVKWADGGAVSLDSLAAKYDDGGAVSVEQQLRDAEMRMRMEAATPLERQTYETLGMEPGLARAAFLPFAGSRRGGDLQLAAPQFIYDLGKAFITPGAAARGVPLSYDDVINTAVNTMGGGLAISSPVEGAVAGMAIKQKGGNWLAGDIERGTEPLRIKTAGGMEPSEALEQMLQNYPADTTNPDVLRRITPVVQQLERNTALNNWIDKKLNRYIRNEMATPEDPVRALAERGILHMRPYDISMPESQLGTKRIGAGMPAAPMGVSPEARFWESITDRAIDPYPAGAYKYGALDESILANNPWLQQVPDEAMVSSAKGLTHDLGFAHIMDELRNAMDPASTLPSNLRIDPKDIDKITVPQAVERVARINDWRTEQAIRAERAGMMANLQAAPRVEVPEFALSFTEQPGGRWVDIPETVDEKGMTLCTSIGKAGGWCTQGQGLAQSYGSGSNRLVALVDAEGRPHAQAKLTSDFDEMSAFDYVLDALTPEQETAFGDFSDAFDRPLELDEALAWMEEEAPDAYIKYQDALNKKADSVPDITEMKPPGNTFDSDRAREYAKRDPQYKAKVTESALKFLNSGDWGKVNQEDLQMFGIVDLKDPSSVNRYLKDIYQGSENADSADMIFNLATDSAEEVVPRFMDRGQFINFLEPYEPMPSEGFAKGGAVRAYDKSKIDELVSKFGTPGFAAGGAVKNYNAAAVDALVNKVLEGNYV